MATIKLSAARKAQLTAEYLRTHQVEPAEKVEKRGRPSGTPPPPEPVRPPYPPEPTHTAEDELPSDVPSVAHPGRFLTRGQVRGLAWMAQVAAIDVAHSNAHWAWKQQLGLTTKK